MRSNVYLSFIVAAIVISLVNQGIIRYTWLQTTDGCSTKLTEWVMWFHRLRVIAMGTLLIQLVYAWWIYRGVPTKAMKLGHVLVSLINVVILSTQMGNKELVELSWSGCTESFEDAYGYIDYCQAAAIVMYGAATMVGHGMPTSGRKREEPPGPSTTSAREPARNSPLTFRGIIVGRP